ncbi:MAG: hypothetical protein AB7Y46_04955 [Armatimonadota bacterium]
MTAVAAKKIVAVLIMKAVLLGAPIEPGMETPPVGYGMAEPGEIRGAMMMYDQNAGVMVVQEPASADLAWLFDSGADVLQAVAQLAYDGTWPPAALEFPWPKDSSAYYLEEIEPDLFRRTELATREGHEVSATFRGEDAVEVELELARRSFTGGEYHQALDAWTQRPLAVRSVVSTTVPLTEERRTLVVWRSPLQPTEGPSLQTGAVPAAGPPPEWAVWVWRLHEEGTEWEGSRSENMRPMGLAVLLELRRWVYEPASPEMRREFEPLARALEQATGARARLDLQHTQTPAEEQLTVVPIAVDGAATISVEGEGCVPVVGLRLADIGAADYFHSNERGTGEQRTVSYDRDALLFPAGASLLAQPSQGAGKMIVLVAGENGLARPTDEAAGHSGASYGTYGISGGFGNVPRSDTPPEGAPDLPFADHVGWGFGYLPHGGRVVGHRFRVWGPASASNEPRASTGIVVRSPAAPAGGLGGYGSGVSHAGPDRQLNIDVRGMALRDVVRMLGQAGDANIVLAEGIDGDRVIQHLTLRGVTVGGALEALLEPLGLEFTRQGEVYHVHKPGERPGGGTGD